MFPPHEKDVSERDRVGTLNARSATRRIHDDLFQSTLHDPLLPRSHPQNARLKIVSPGNRAATDHRYLAPESWLIAGLMFVGIMFAGCASPGPPRAPSLQLPETVHDLAVSRSGDAVTIRFTLPQRTTDNLPIRESAVNATLCAAPEGSPCKIVPSRQNIKLAAGPAADRAVTWTVDLPPTDTTGEPKLLAYRLQLSNLADRAAGWSDPAYTVSGAAPQPVERLHADETPTGILLRWQPGGPDEVLIQREDLTPPAAKEAANRKPARKNAREPVWLVSHAEPSGPRANETLDTSASEDVPYRYTAVRRRTVQLAQQKVELRSAISPPVEITWRNLFPPPAPTGFSAAPFTESGGFSVDLVWEPIEEPGLKGYIVSRQAIDATGSATASVQRLTPAPIPLPAFHDATAQAAARYKYSVQAVSHKGVESAPATIIVEPTAP